MTQTSLPVEYIAGLPGPRLARTSGGKKKNFDRWYMVKGNKKIEATWGYRCSGYGNGAKK
jgi:hypothetical protein